jgi:NhaA family Na+:H+ antiporter
MSVWNQRVRRFFSTEAAGGIFLVGAAFLALILANSPAKKIYFDFTHQSHFLVNEILMSGFFFLVGLEIKREFTDGELGSPKKAALPIIAALGGMITPALIYAAFNAGGLASRGWAIPMPTDIALALGVLALLGSRIDSSLKIFLLTLAIADDLFSIIVLAVFYSSGIEPIRIIGTIGAVILAFLIPARKTFTTSRLIDLIHPWSAFLIVPLFALVNVGITIDFSNLADQLNSPVARGIIFGRVVGKFIGITLFAWLAIKIGIATKSDAISFPEIAGAAALAGMGLTVSLFIAELALTQSNQRESVKLALLISALIAGIFGYLTLRMTSTAQD